MKQHILIVDDEAPVLDLLSAYFTKRGYQVTAKNSADDAISAVEDAQFDVVILDVLLADKDGLEVLAQIKSTHPNLPVIIMTGIGFDEQLLQEAVQKGAAGYVSKTLPLDQLLMEVHRVLKYKQ